jgi:hypothetical protein
MILFVRFLKINYVANTNGYKIRKCYSGNDCDNTQFMSLIEGTLPKDLFHFHIYTL